MPNNPNNNTFATATEILTVSAGAITRKGELSAADTVDYYKFTTASVSNVNIKLTDLTGNAKVRLGKLNSAGTFTEELPLSDNGGKLSEALLKTGIAAGTYYIEVTLSGTAPTANYTLSTFASADTSYSSLLWRNETLQGTSPNSPPGVAATWQLQGKDYGDARFLPGGTDANGNPIPDIALPANLYIAGTGDLNGDGADDIIWRDRSDGSVFTWMMDGKTILKKADGSYDAAIIEVLGASGALEKLPIPENWILAGVADIDGDLKSDMLWRNLTDGTTYVWRMDGTKIASVKQIEGIVPGEWDVAGLADTNKDGKSDILWRQRSTGIVAIWLLDANTASGIAAVTGAQKVTAPIDLNYKIVAFTDVTGDGRADIIWRNASGGKVAFWEINGADLVLSGATRVVDATIPADFFIAGIADFDGDQRADLLWRNNNGFVGLWTTDLTSVSGFKLQREFAVINPTTNAEDTVSPSGQYTIEAVKDFNGDGKADIFWRNPSLGETGVWTIKNTSPTSPNGKFVLDLTQTGFIPIGAGFDYSIKGVLNTKFTRQPQTLTTGDARTAFNLGVADGIGNYVESVSGTSKDLYNFKLERNSTLKLELLNPTNLSTVQGSATYILRKQNEDGTFTVIYPDPANPAAPPPARFAAGTYQIEVGSTAPVATTVVPYNLRVTGTPIAIDLVGKVFTPPASVTLETVPDPNATTKPKSQIDVNYTIENKEPSDSGAVKVRFYISRDETIDPTADKLLKVVSGATFLDETVVANVPGNSPGVAGTVKLELPDGTDLFWLNDRDYYIGMVIDPVSTTLPTGEIEETGERDVNNPPIPNVISNNYNQALGKDKQVIGVTNTQVPNLQVLQLSAETTTLTRTSTSNFTYTVRNDGKRSTQGLVNGVEIALYISDQSDLTFENLKTQGARVFLDDVNGGAPIAGLTTVADLTGTFSLASVNANYWEARPGITQYYLYAFVDSNTSIGESDESDNVFKAVTQLTIS
ncbi:MAG: VCBS repeat-containing protein [Alkalinema sp. RU_4_3]|nr:VCBS repeat-containing protein [Alkalinema sp. RU_4_3]